VEHWVSRSLVTLALRTADGQVANGVAPNVGATAGYALAVRIAAVLVALAGVLVLLLMEKVSAKPRTPGGRGLTKYY